jgi:hypothetical protein
MAQIVLGIGTSHTPMLNAAADEWPLFEELDRQRAHLHKDGRHATYDDELLAIAPPWLRAELAPEKLAKRHGEAMAAVNRLHAAARVIARPRERELACASAVGPDGQLADMWRYYSPRANCGGSFGFASAIGGAFLNWPKVSRV